MARDEPVYFDLRGGSTSHRRGVSATVDDTARWHGDIEDIRYRYIEDIDMCIDMCISTLMDMCLDMRIDMCIDMCLDTCMGMCMVM